MAPQIAYRQSQAALESEAAARHLTGQKGRSESCEQPEFMTNSTRSSYNHESVAAERRI